MAAQFQYTTLAHQTQAVQALAEVFDDVRFIAPHNAHANPTLVPREAATILRANIAAVRARNHVHAGDVNVPATATPALTLDVMMETGTGKTFTFIETIHRLHRDRKLAKFIVLVPSNAIRQGTLKSLQTTAAFFARQYDQHIGVYNYSAKTVGGFIHASNAGISVLVATYQSFAGDSKVINQRGVEANLFGHAKSYMEALAAIHPVLIIDEPHRFEGKQTQEYLAKFEPAFIVRFGATFPLGTAARGAVAQPEYKNLIYTLDSLEAFRQRLVKGIAVDTVGNASEAAQTLCYLSVHGSSKERSAHVDYRDAQGKTTTCELKAKDNLGTRTGIGFLDGHVVEGVTAKEVLFTNGFSLQLGQPAAYGMLAEQTQSLIVERSVANHFEREEDLFKRGIKSLSLFFIDAVAKYMPADGKPADLRTAFEHHYRTHLALTLARADLHPPYRAYLERSRHDIGRVHKGYFARSHSDKNEEEAIKLILQEKEKLLSFDTDLRFIFSMWALQEGWDNPNVFTLCKLAPSHSSISKLQQIGRGLRLAVNQQLERVQSDDPAFDEVNQLVVVVPASEGDFVAQIQGEIASHSVQRVAREFDDKVLADFGVAPSTRVAYRVLDALSQLGVVSVDEVSGKATLLIERTAYHAMRERIVASLNQVQGLAVDNARKMLDYLDAYYDGYGRVQHKQAKLRVDLHINPSRFAQFKELWAALNRDAIVRYELETPRFIDHACERIASNFQVRPLTISVTRTDAVHAQHEARSTEATYEVRSHTVFTLAGFVRELANATNLSFQTVASVLSRMPPDKFAQIRHNEARALAVLRDVLLDCIYELIVHSVTYELRQTRVQTALTDNTGTLLRTVSAALCGHEQHPVQNEAVLARSLYDDNFMPVDSQPERATVDESHDQRIAVFAKLPKINIPTPAGNYNPDFGYALLRDGEAQALYLVVETKGYDNMQDIPPKERRKIESAKRFFQALRDSGTPVHFETRLNSDRLTQLIAQIRNPSLESQP